MDWISCSSLLDIAVVGLQLRGFGVVACAATPKPPGLLVDAGIGAQADEGLRA